MEETDRPLQTSADNLNQVPGLHTEEVANRRVAVFPNLDDPVDVKRGDHQCETAFLPSSQPDKVD